MAINVMSRSFTKREKGLFLILAIALIAVVYYFGVVVNVQNTKAANEEEIASIQNDIAVQEKITELRTKMEYELESLGSLSELPQVAVYDNVSNEISELNGVLSSASDYDISFETPTLEGDTIRRNVKVSYTVPNYTEALSIVDKLQNGKYRCEVTNFDLTAKLLANGSIESVSGSLDITYYETAVGATNLNGLQEVAPSE